MSSQKRPSRGRYRVGYKRPPAHAQFRPGRSGNPAGRPKGSKNAQAIFEKVINENVTLNENVHGKKRRRRMSLVEAAFKQAGLGAAAGSHRSTEQFIKLLSIYKDRLQAEIGLTREQLQDLEETLSLSDEELKAYYVELLNDPEIKSWLNTPPRPAP